MRRVPHSIVAAAATAAAGPSPSLTSTAAVEQRRTASFFGWKPYANRESALAEQAAEKEAAEAREAQKRYGSHVYKTRDGNIDENMMRDMYERGGPVDLVSDDIPVRNLPRPSDGSGGATWEGGGGGDLVPTGSPASSSSEGGNSGEIANVASHNEAGAVESFDSYKKSTLAYMSNVNPDSLIGVGLGAGFGEVEDSRLGFLRPSKKADAPRTPEEEEAWMRDQKAKGLMDPEEGDSFLDGSVYRPSKQGLQGLTLLGGSRDEAFAASARRQKEKYDAIDKAMRDGTFNKSLSKTDIDSALNAVAGEGGGADGRVAVYNAEREYGLAKTDEEKKAIRERQRRLAQLQLASALKRMGDWRGTTFSPKEHFLLADLDYDKDSLLFGRTREEFEANVKKMKSVVIGYTKWERRDNWYKYGTWLAKAFAAMLVYEIYETTKARNMLITYYDDFTSVVSESINDLEARRCEDIAKAMAEFELHPPDFAPLKAAVEAERKRLRAERAAQIRAEEVAIELQQREEALMRKRAAAAVAMFGGGGSSGAANNDDDDDAKKLRQAAAEAAAAAHRLAASPEQTANSLAASFDATTGAIKRHPMDTTGVTYEKNVKEMEGLKDALFKSDELAAKVRAASPVDAGTDSSTPFVTAESANAAAAASAAAAKPSMMVAAAELFHNYLIFGGLRGYFATDHRVGGAAPAARASATPAAAPSPVPAANAGAFAASNGAPATTNGGLAQISAVASEAVSSGSSSSNASVPAKTQRLLPLTKAEEDERILATLAYSVSPTSIEAIKQLRRTLLPRSEDFTHIVRQQMAEHRAAKAGVTVFPGSSSSASSEASLAKK